MSISMQTLQAFSAQHGSDAFLDEKLVLGQLAQGLPEPERQALSWCVNHFVYHRLYADQNIEHAQFFRYGALQQMAAELSLSPDEAAAALDPWVELVDADKQRNILADIPAEQPGLFKRLWELKGNAEDGNAAYARSGLSALVSHTPLAATYAGLSWLAGEGADPARAFALFTEGAAQKNRDCLWHASQCLLHGQGTPADEEAALQKILESSQAFQPDALLAMGVMQYHGYKNVAQNRIRSLFCLHWAARQGQHIARCFLAVHFFIEHQLGHVTGAGRFFTSETLPMAEAFFKVAHLYDTGECLVQNEDLARQNYLLAVKFGSGEAAAIVRERYVKQQEVDELGLRVSTLDGRTQLAKEANSGDVESMYKLAQCYMDGIGYERSLPVALSWFRRGAAKGHAGCEQRKAVVNHHIGAEYLTDGTKRGAKGVSFLKEALAAADLLDENLRCDSHYLLGTAYYEGMAGEADLIAAHEHMEYALKRNYLPALLYMAGMRLKGGALEQDYEEAFRYYFMALDTDGESALPLVLAARKVYRQADADAPALSPEYAARLDALEEPAL